jgi:hypothetical protein
LEAPKLFVFSSGFFAKPIEVTDSQDDVFVGRFEIRLVGYAENTKRSKKLQALRMTILSEFDEDPRQVNAYGLTSWAKFSQTSPN